MIYRKWEIARTDPGQTAALAKELGVSPLVSQVLCARGVKTPDTARALLGEEGDLSDPFLLKDMDRLVQRLHRAIEEDEKIVVYGDYDVDGVTATALMLGYLESAGAHAYYKLPNRAEDGYGLSRDVIDLLAGKQVSLLLTVDNGVSAADEIEYARGKGLDVLVTDHHLPPAQLPNAAAVVDPLRFDDESPAKNLSGVGVAFKVICAMEGCPPSELLPCYADLVAIGTVADMMTLTGENRLIVKSGVEALQSVSRCGLAALLRSCGLEDKPIGAENISFGIAPRLNAAGRMEDASAALQLLVTEDEEEAEELVASLNDCNAKRQETEQAIAAELTARIDADPVLSHRAVLTVWGRGYHQGVIGIVASRLLERYGKPCIVFTIDENGEARGSGRSFAGFSLYKAIASCADLLDRFGGHDLAAGLSLPREKLETFAERINAYADGVSVLQPPLCLDGVFCPETATVAEVAGLSALAPFGNGNPSPLFLLENARIDAIYPVSEGRHLRYRFVSGGTVFQAVLFGMSPAQSPYRVGDTVDAALALSVYEGGMQKSISGRVRAMRPHGLEDAYLEGFDLYSRCLSGGRLSTEQKREICPARADVVWLYREIEAGRVNRADLRPQFARYGAAKAGALLVALDVLVELGHVAPREDGSGFLAPTGGRKRPLEESRLLKSLEE